MNKVRQYQELPLFDFVAERQAWPFDLAPGERLCIGSDCSGVESFMYAVKELCLKPNQVQL